MGRRPELNLDSRRIKEMYLTDQYTCQDLADKFGCTSPAIRNHLVMQGVKLRPRGKWKFKYPKFPFRGDLCEEAYLVGFRIGDLNVYKEREHSRAIIVRCHTTQLVQVDLCKKIFQKYSKVVVGKSSDGTFQIRCYLDLSFSFLIDKNKIPYRYAADRNAGWAFIAGYTDAEGNFIINQGRARFKIDSYDLHVLRWTHQFLIRGGINSKLRKIGEKGTAISPRSNIVWNQDLWRLNVNAAESLDIFMEKLLPHLQHGKRIKDAKIALANIQKRKYAKH